MAGLAGFFGCLGLFLVSDSERYSGSGRRQRRTLSIRYAREICPQISLLLKQFIEADKCSTDVFSPKSNIMVWSLQSL